MLGSPPQGLLLLGHMPRCQTSLPGCACMHVGIAGRYHAPPSSLACMFQSHYMSAQRANEIMPHTGAADSLNRHADAFPMLAPVTPLQDACQATAAWPPDSTKPIFCKHPFPPNTTSICIQPVSLAVPCGGCHGLACALPPSGRA